jgi:hypothetical protein
MAGILNMPAERKEGILGLNNNQGTGIWHHNLSGSKEQQLDQLQKSEKQFYKENPRMSLQLTPTDEPNTVYGLPVYKDQHGNRHSESSITFPLTEGGEWITVSSIYPDSKTGVPRYHTEDEVREIILTNKFVNPVNQEQVPKFKSMDEAINYALERDLSLQ